MLSWFGTGIYFSAHRFRPAGKLAGDWYANFERSRRRTRIGMPARSALGDTRAPY